MEWISWIILYLLAGFGILKILLVKMKINWQEIDASTRLLLIATPFMWPLVIVFIVLVGIFKK